MKNIKGFTLAEVLISALILGFALGSSLLVYSKCSHVVDSGSNTSLALDHASAVIEEIRVYNDPSAVVAEDWTTWAQNNVYDSLEGEAITVTYPSGTSATPLEIFVTVQWEDASGRQRDVQLITLLTQR
jgi:Tfp pilus assembly protein PilV